MNVLDRVQIKGFWGNKDIDLKLFEDVNFLIGTNGTGKTTVINLVAAALSADFPTLDKIEFSSITLVLSEVGGSKKPIIQVEKRPSEESPFPEIIYKIKEKTSDSFKEYSLDDFEEESLLRRQTKRSFAFFLRKSNKGLLSRIKSLVDSSWLSIHRAASRNKSDDGESYESSVDIKLIELTRDLSDYFAILSSKVSEEITNFQKDLIVSLLTETEEAKVISLVRKMDLELEKKSLDEIFSKLNLPVGKRLESHFRRVSTSIKRLEGPEPLKMNDVMFLLSAYRSHRVVQDWNKLLEKQVDILKPQNTFIEVLNSLLQRKKIRINDRNAIEVETQSGKLLSIRELSSGEKQLVIILGEALLQQGAPWVYIADEPELSLHVTWQESLISNLRLLNPNAQILCATHSPDVVSSFSDNIFNMEEEIK